MMSGQSRVSNWLWVIGIGLILYLVNASMLIYYQALYYQNPGSIEFLTSVLPTYSSLINNAFQSGLFGVLGVLSIIITLIMAYITAGIAISRTSSVRAKASLVMLAIIQLLMGNPGFVIGLILVLVGSLLTR